jgi:hypothetical protein
MDERERQIRHESRPAAGEGAPGGNLDALSAAANRMIAAADSALERVLSGNSEEFLRANRQHGGQ